MKASAPVFKRGRAELWTRERLQQLARLEVVQLRANAERLAEPELAALCAEVLKERPARGAASSGAASRPKMRTRLIARTKAFEARGVFLVDVRTSWSGVRKSDGGVVIAMWAAAVLSKEGGCSCLLWAPNVKGERPWSDTAAGRERLDHCKLALERGGAEGLLVHGERIDGRLPEERARSVLGIDPETVIRFEIDKRDDEYWARWGKAAA